MVPGPRPMIGGFSTLARVDANRALDCPEYDGCLDKACAEGWPNWTCRACPHYRPPEVPGVDGDAGPIPIDLATLAPPRRASEEHKRNIGEAMRARRRKG